MDYAQAVDWLYSRQKAGIKLGLDNIRRLLADMQLPPADLRIVHVAGTNGKGSTCAFAESLLRQSGLRTGLFTSPHLISFCERIRINGEPIAEEFAAPRIVAIKKRIEDWDAQPTFFEITTALALQSFVEKEVDVVVMEVGLGGRLDSTNAITPTVCGVTPIALDHCHILGDDIATIAGEKAGIFKPGVPVVSAPQLPEATAVLTARAEKVGTTIETIAAPWPEETALPGDHQRWNAALAVALLRVGGFEIKADAIAQGIAATSWPARFERIELPGGLPLVIDGAHNAAGARIAAETWRQHFGEQKATVIFSSAANKDTTALIEPLAAIAQQFICVEPDTLRRTATAEQLHELVPSEMPSECAQNVAAALDRARQLGAPILVAGSLFLAGEMLAILRDSHDQYEPSEQ